MSHPQSHAYKQAGVDVTAGYESIDRIRPLVERTYTKGVLGTIGGFGGLFQPDLAGMAEPVLISGADGVGTKLKLAFAMDKHDTIGIDAVAMCVNDIICAGAAPLFFLDYLALGKNIPTMVADIVAGISEGCVQAGCALVGGETAEMPGFYPVGEYDLAGFAVGMVDKAKIIDGKERIKAGDALIALRSNGVHSNGFSLVRKLFGDTRDKLERYVDGLGCTLGEELLKPTRIYVKPVLEVVKQYGDDVHGLCHITGGGFYENIPRMLPDGLTAQICTENLQTPEIFNLVEQAGDISKEDMYTTFNMGVGFVLAVAADKADAMVKMLEDLGECAYMLGKIVSGKEGVDMQW